MDTNDIQTCDELRDHHDTGNPTADGRRPCIRMRHMSMDLGAGFADRGTNRTFHNVTDANMAIAELAVNHSHGCEVILEPDDLSAVPGALHAVIYWGAVSDRYHLDTITYADIHS